jgi:hypothetical protein
MLPFLPFLDIAIYILLLIPEVHLVVILNAQILIIWHYIGHLMVIATILEVIGNSLGLSLGVYGLKVLKLTLVKFMCGSLLSLMHFEFLDY